MLLSLSTTVLFLVSPDLIAFDGKEWKKIIRSGDTRNSTVVDKDNNMKIFVRINNEWIEIGSKVKIGVWV